MRGIEEIATIHLTWREHADRWRKLLQRADLHGRGVRTQQRVVAQVQRIVQFHGRMIRREVERTEVVPFGFRFRAERDREAELAEDLADLIDDQCHRMERALPFASRRHGRVEGAGGSARGLARREGVE